MYAIRSYYDFEGRTILHAPGSPAAVEGNGIPAEAELRAILPEAKEILYRERNRRPPPLRDEKILSAWNGLTISACARAGLVLGDSRYVGQAGRAAEFLLANLYRDGRLHRIFMDGKAKNNAYLESYNFV